MRGKKQHDEEHVDESWLLPYSDMLTLLLALFIVMFAMSKVDNQKLIALSQQFNVIFTGGKGILNDSGENDSNITQSDNPSMSNKENSIVEQDKMSEIKNTLEQEIKNEGYSDKVKVSLNGEGVDISIQDTVIFNTGKADILSNFYPLLIKISNMIKDLDNEIRISGYTDNVPIENKEFRSNWDLSYMRASNVMNFMVNKGNVAPDKFSIQAHGQYRPKYDNSTEQGRAQNRRVDILIVRKYASTSTNKN
ncbi:flagellar motor protein MotB [Clostridium sp. WILCCON 0269]|uniref:Flagellar motor protein MotB n=1 Tax=Candidatus Clostridium eludens TaxID=3381663 RepID=A0ABW8SG78_9CLOT